MRIVHQIAPFSYSSTPDVPLLAAPRIAGLLPANTQSAPKSAPPHAIGRLVDQLLIAVPPDRQPDVIDALGMLMFTARGITESRDQPNDLLGASHRLIASITGQPFPTQQRYPHPSREELDARLLDLMAFTQEQMDAIRAGIKSR